MRRSHLLLGAALLWVELPAMTPPSTSAPAPAERQLTSGPLQKNLDNNRNFSPDGRYLAFDCRGLSGINGNDRLGRVDVRTGEVSIFYVQTPPVLGVGAASYIGPHEVVVIHALTTGPRYDFTVRGGMIVADDGSRRIRWLDSRDVVAPYTPGALRGGTHKHEPDATGRWVGFTYNDDIVRASGASNLRNVGVSQRGRRARVHPDADGRNFEGESFSVLLTECVPQPRPGSDEYDNAVGDCWVGDVGYPKADGRVQRARAFVGRVTVMEDGQRRQYGEVFVVDVPDDITIPGPSGPLEGTATDYPKPPAGATVRRLTRTAEARDRARRGVSGHLRASGDGRWIAFVARCGRPAVPQVHVVDPKTGRCRQLSKIAGGVVGDPRFSPASDYVAVATPDGAVVAVSARPATWGRVGAVAPPNPRPASNIVVSPDARTIAFNRDVDGVRQIFCAAVGPPMP